MFRPILSIIAILCLSCGSGEGSGHSGEGVRNDAIQIHYDRARDRELSQEERSREINRAWSLLDGNTTDSILGYVLYEKAMLHLSSKEYDSLLYCHELFNGLDSLIEDDLNKARQYYLMGYYHAEIAKDYEKGFLNYSRSKDYYGRIKDSLWVGRNLLNMGTLQKDRNDFFGSKETLTEALQYLKSPEDDVVIAQCYNLLATNHRKLSNYGDAVLYFNLAIEKAGSQSEKRSFENNLATSHIDEGQYGKAIAILERIGQDTSLKKTSTQYARILDNLSYARWLFGERRDPDGFLDALKIRIKNKDHRGQIASYTHLGEFYSKEDPERAMVYFDSVIHLSKRELNPLAEKDAIGFLMDLRPEDIGLRDRYVFLQDSLYREELKVKTQFAKYKYDDMQNKESILKLEMENAEKELEASRHGNQMMISIFVMALLLLGIAFTAYFFKQRTKRLAQENQTARLEATLDSEAQMSRRLHDDFGAGLNQAMLMVQGKSDTNRLLDVLDSLYQQSRSFSREINEPDTGTRFKEEFMEMLRLRTQAPTNLLLKGYKDMDWNAVPPLSKKVLYKVLQELMINMGKHSQASLVTIDFKMEDGQLKVGYSDNGVGAGPNDLKSKNGLRNTEKRIEAIGGTIIFDSGKDEGFRAKMVFPC